MKKGIAIIILILIGIGLVACEGATTMGATTTTATTTPTTSETFTTVNVPLVMEFDFDSLDDTSTTLLSLDDYVIISGNNITTADYTVDLDSDMITFKKEYLAYLSPGIYTYTLHRVDGEEDFNLNVVDKLQENRIINESFETGDLFGWEARTIFKGESNLLAFPNSVVIENELIPGSVTPYGGVGDYLVGIDSNITESLYQEKMGILRSSTFILGGSGYITFRLGGGSNPSLSYISVRRTSDDYEVGRFGNLEPSVINEAELVLFKADLSLFLGESLYLEVVDVGGHEGDYLVFDDFLTYHETIPAGITATNQAPIFIQSYVPNQLPNGDFSSGLEGWTEVYGEAFLVSDDTLKSNLGGDEAKGVIRSTLFRVDGSGIATIKLGAAQGARYDKDTFVSVKELGTNHELLRFANRNHDGITMITYYLDLSEYLGKVCYFEIVDNAEDGYDTIFVSDIVTYYQERPEFTYQDLALNLNE